MSVVKLRSVRFILGFGVITLLFVVANVISYFSEQSAYYKFLGESGWVWAGHWTWGFPFRMVLAGLGFDNHSQLAPFGVVANVLVWLISAGFIGICCEILADRLQSKSE